MKRRTISSRFGLIVATGILSISGLACGSDSPNATTSDASTPATSAAAIATTADTASKTTTADTASETSGADDPAMQELIAAAQKEGTVTWYMSGNLFAERVPPAFKALYGIDVEVVGLPGTELETRFGTEVDAGVQLPDVVTDSTAAFWSTFAERGVFVQPAEWGVPAVDEIPAENVIDGAVTMWKIGWNIGYNTDLVKKEDVPTSFEGVLDPRWADNIILLDPKSSPVAVEFYDGMFRTYGPELLTGLGAQAATSYPSSSAATEALAAGEAPLLVPGVPSAILAAQANGAPIDFVTPDATVGVVIDAGLVKDAAHPNAAKLLLNFLLSQSTNEQYVTNLRGELSPYGGEEFPSKYIAPDPASAVANKDKILSLLGL